VGVLWSVVQCEQCAYATLQVHLVRPNALGAPVNFVEMSPFKVWLLPAVVPQDAA
jgi:hypothetical protein